MNKMSAFWLANDLGKCWMCGAWTRSVLMDLGYQHIIDCDMFPTKFGDVKIVKGVRVDDTDYLE